MTSANPVMTSDSAMAPSYGSVTATTESYSTNNTIVTTNIVSTNSTIVSTKTNRNAISKENSSHGESISTASDEAESLMPDQDSPLPPNAALSNMTLRRFAIDISLYFNLFILFTKALAYLHTLSLSVLAALTDSLLDVISQIVLHYTERTSSMSRSSAFYPAGASRLEPIGVLVCAALMGMASFEILKQSIEALVVVLNGSSQSDEALYLHNNAHMLSIYGMMSIVLAKLLLYVLCHRARPTVYKRSRTHGQLVPQKASDPTLEALALDHWNDAWSNAIAAVALLCAMVSKDLWFLDPLGAIAISIYIIYNWFETGREQIEQLTGKSAPEEFIDELHELVNSFDSTGRYRIITDVVRAYHFGPKFLVEVEIVLPKDTLLMDSHDIGMELQYEIEGRDEVERCFVHIDYEQRPYDEHVVSKVPELRERYRPSASGNHSFNSSVHSV